MTKSDATTAGAADVRLRPVRESDVPALARLYADAVHELAPGAYTADAVRVWAAFAEQAAFRDFVLEPDTLVAEDATGPVAFGGVDATGRIASLYVRPDRSRRGIASRVLAALLASRPAGTRFWTQASALSRPLFEKFGFELVETEIVVRDGVSIERAILERRS